MAGDERIPVIKHGGLGDWVLATGCFAAIRRHHPKGRITLLTAPAFADWGAHCGWFDEVWADERPSLIAEPFAWTRLRRRLIDAEFARVYDLQTSGRTGLGQVAALARRAACAVGNDTGPIHIAATAGCPSVVLFGGASDPKRSAPCGEAVTVLRRLPLTGLSVDEVIGAVAAIDRASESV